MDHPRLWGSALAPDLGLSKSSHAISPLTVGAFLFSLPLTESTDGEPWLGAGKPGTASRVSIWVELPREAGRDLKCPFASLLLAAFLCAHVPFAVLGNVPAVFGLRRGTGGATGELSETPLLDGISM